MTIKAEIVCDSMGPSGIRLTTMQLTYPRMIHSEYMTHRVFSRNASSSRAIPVKKLIDMALEDPAFFESVRYNEAGMQGQTELTPEHLQRFYTEWLELMNISAGYALRWAGKIEDGGYGIHKQHANRVMEPWHHIKVVHTATDWDNFWELRCHADAEPTMRALADAMHFAYVEGTPVHLSAGDWHLPYVRADERKVMPLQWLVECSTARCARVSYMNHDGTHPNVEKDRKLHDALVAGVPRHASPTEHQAEAVTKEQYLPPIWGSNLRGWHQYRKFIEHGGLPIGPPLWQPGDVMGVI